MTMEIMMQQYAHSKGAHTDQQGWEAIQDQLLLEYGFLAPTIKQVRYATLAVLPLKSLVYAKRHFSRIDPRSPLVDAEGQAITLPIVGLVRLQGNNYHLVDGHHRLKWCFEHQWEDAPFIVVSPHPLPPELVELQCPPGVLHEDHEV